MPESVTLKVDATGGITATLYSCAFWGNSPETMVAQLVAEEFDCDPHDVSIVYQGSRNGLPATGPGGSRTTVMLAGAVEGATAKIKAKALRAAAHLLEADPDDLEWDDGGYQVKGVPEQRKTLGEIAVMLHLFKHSFPEDMESGLEDSKVFDHPYTTMPSADRKDLGVFYPFMGHACHVPVVEVDIETGRVSFLSYAAVHDCGTLVNPRSLAGHIVGGTAQGIGTALYEEFVYDDDGQLLTSSYLDYLIPTAMEVPEIKIGHHETPSPWTPHGIKGGGEGGRMMAPAAINVAVNDALAPLGVRLTELPLTPDRIRAALRAAGTPEDPTMTRPAPPDPTAPAHHLPPRTRPRWHTPKLHPAGAATPRARHLACAAGWTQTCARAGPRRGGGGAMSDRVAVVTGGNRGIGRAIAVALAADGFAVAVTARDPATAADTVAAVEAGGGHGRGAGLRRQRRGVGDRDGAGGRRVRPGAHGGGQRGSGRADGAAARDRATRTGGLSGHRPGRRVPDLPRLRPGADRRGHRLADRDLVDDRQAPAARPHALRGGQDGGDRPGPDAGPGAGAARGPGQRGLPGRRHRAPDGRRDPPPGRDPRHHRGRGPRVLHRRVAAEPAGRGGRGRGQPAPSSPRTRPPSITGEDLNVNAGVVMY